MKTLTYSIVIDQPQEMVFRTMTDRELYPKWAKAWGEGMMFRGEWVEGGYLSFCDVSQGGTKALIEKLVPNEVVHMKHVAMVDAQNEEVELTDDMMHKWIGSTEQYSFQPQGEQSTLLEVVVGADEVFQEMMDLWAEALQSLKELCES